MAPTGVDYRRRASLVVPLLARFGSGYAVAVYILFCAVVSIVSTSLLPDYTNRDISAEHDAV